MDSNKNPVTFRIPPNMLAFLGKRAAKQRRTLSDYVRLVLEDHRKKVEAQKRASKEER